MSGEPRLSLAIEPEPSDAELVAIMVAVREWSLGAVESEPAEEPRSLWREAARRESVKGGVWSPMGWGRFARLTGIS